MVEGGFILSRNSGGLRFTFEGALPRVLCYSAWIGYSEWMAAALLESAWLLSLGDT